MKTLSEKDDTICLFDISTLCWNILVWKCSMKSKNTRSEKMFRLEQNLFLFSVRVFSLPGSKTYVFNLNIDLMKPKRKYVKYIQ